MTTFWTVDGHPALQNGQLIVNMIDPCDIAEHSIGCSSVYFCCCPNAYDTELAAVCPDKPCKLKIRITRAQPLPLAYIKDELTGDWPNWSAANCSKLNGSWELTKQAHYPGYRIVGGTVYDPIYEYVPICETDPVSEDVNCVYGGVTYWSWPESYNRCCNGSWQIVNGVANPRLLVVNEVANPISLLNEAHTAFKSWLEEEHEAGDLLSLDLRLDTRWHTVNGDLPTEGFSAAVYGYGVASYYTGETYTDPETDDVYQIIAIFAFSFRYDPVFSWSTRAACIEALVGAMCGNIGCVYADGAIPSHPWTPTQYIGLRSVCSVPHNDFYGVQLSLCTSCVDLHRSDSRSPYLGVCLPPSYTTHWGPVYDEQYGWRFPPGYMGVCAYSWRSPWICIGDDCDDCKPPTTVPPFTPPDYVPPVAANPCGCCSWADAPPETIVITIGGATSGGDTCYDCSTKMNGPVICYLTEAGEGCTYTGFRAMGNFDCSRLCDDPVTVLKYTVQLSCFEEEEILYLSAAISIISVDSNGNYDGCFSVAFQGYGPTADCAPADTPCSPNYSDEIHDCMEEGDKSLLQCIDECIENNEGDSSGCVLGGGTPGGTSLPLDVYLYPYCSGLVNVGIQFNRQLCEEGNTPYWW